MYSESHLNLDEKMLSYKKIKNYDFMTIFQHQILKLVESKDLSYLGRIHFHRDVTYLEYCDSESVLVIKNVKTYL